MEIKTSNSGWWAFIISGLVAMVYGLLALLLPKEIIEIVMMVSGIVLIVIGLICAFFAFKRKKETLPWGLLLVEAIGMVVMGIVAIVWSKETVMVMVFLIGLWSIIIGTLMFASVFRFTGLVNRGFYLVSASLSVLFGVLLMVNPFGSAEVFVTITGVLALVFGIIMMMFGFTVRKIDKDVTVVEVQE